MVSGAMTVVGSAAEVEEASSDEVGQNDKTGLPKTINIDE